MLVSFIWFLNWNRANGKHSWWWCGTWVSIQWNGPALDSWLYCTVIVEWDCQVIGGCEDITIATISQLWTFSRVAMYSGSNQIDIQSEPFPCRHIKKRFPLTWIGRCLNIELYVYESGAKEMLLFPIQKNAFLWDTETINTKTNTFKNTT